MLKLLRFLLTVDITIWRFKTFRKPSIMVEDLLYHSNMMCREMTSPNFNKLKEVLWKKLYL